MTLFEIDQRIEFIFENCTDPETGEIDPGVFDELEKLGIARDVKIESIALYIKNIRADIDALDAEIKSFKARKERAAGTLTRLESYLFKSLDGNKFRTAKTDVTFRKTQHVEVSDIYQVPEAYLRYKAPEADKTAIKAAIKAGNKVPGARLVDGLSMVIK